MRDLILAKALTKTAVSEATDWPKGETFIEVMLDDASFTTSADGVTYEVECSFDGGRSWPFLARVKGTIGSWKNEDGSAPKMRCGSFVVAGEAVNPTHYRARLVPTKGAPTVGIKGT